LQARYRQEFAAFAPITSKALVNGRWNKVVNIASTEMMKKISLGRRVPYSQWNMLQHDDDAIPVITSVAKQSIPPQTQNGLLRNDGG
jgi:hypothetical protein